MSKKKIDEMRLQLKEVRYQMIQMTKELTNLKEEKRQIKGIDLF